MDAVFQYLKKKKKLKDTNLCFYITLYILNEGFKNSFLKLLRLLIKPLLNAEALNIYELMLSEASAAVKQTPRGSCCLAR